MVQSQVMPPLRATIAMVDLDAIDANVRELRRITDPAAELMAVVKADAYGHGLTEVAPVCLAAGASRLGVAIPDEAFALRARGITAPILVIGYCAPWQVAEMIRQGIAITVFTLADAAAASDAALRLRRSALVHIKVDTGMARLGIWPDADGLVIAERIARLPGLELEGVFTHFASADEADKSYAREQFERYMWFIDGLAARGIRPRIRHAANSAALLDLPATHLDMVRPGVLVPGLWPSDEVDRRIALRPAMTVLTHAGMVKEVPAGRKVSYGSTYMTTERAVLATLPLGYHDGYRRAFSNRADVLVRGRRAPVRGRVCMDQTVVDVTAAGAIGPGEPVVVLGRYGAEEVSAEELAGYSGTIGYEIATTIGKRVPRLYLRAGRPVKLVATIGSWELGGWQDLPWPGGEAAYLRISQANKTT